MADLLKETLSAAADTSLDPSSLFENWEQLLQTPIFEEDLDALSVAEQGQDYWEKMFNDMNFPGMDLMAVSYQPRPDRDAAADRKLFNRSIREFVRFLSYHHTNDLRNAGVTDEGLFYMKRGQQPENFTVHLKYPLDYGGTISFDNMVFMQDRPFHELIHLYLNRQLLGPEGRLSPARLYVPVPPRRVYIPMTAFTGTGGKNKQDRSVMSGFTQSALKDLAIRSMPGR